MRRIEAHCGGEFPQQFRRRHGTTGGAPGAQHDHRGLASGEGQRGMVEAGQPGVQGGMQAASAVATLVAAHGHQLPAGGELFDLHRRVLEFWLARHGIGDRQGQAIDAGAAHVASAPVHRHMGLRRAQRGRGRGTQQQRAALALDPHQIAVDDAAPFHVARMHFDRRFRRVGVQARHEAGAAHAVPLVAQAARVEMQRMARIGGFGQRAVLHFDEAGAAAGGGEYAVAIETRRTPCGAGGQRPLLGPGLFQQRIGEAADVEVAADGAGAVLVENLLDLHVGKQRRTRWSVRAERSRSPSFDRILRAGDSAARVGVRANGGETIFQSPREIHRDAPVGPRLARCGDCCAHA